MSDISVINATVPPVVENNGIINIQKNNITEEYVMELIKLVNTVDDSAEVTLGEEQQQAYDIITSNIGKGFTMLFLTGAAGTGKSFLVNELRRTTHCKVAAPTGLAAENVRGTTIHKLFGLNLKATTYSTYLIDKLVGEYDLLIIDEVSMVGKRLFDLIYNMLRHSNMTVLFVGDFFQLPPIDDAYAFQSKNWIENVGMLSLRKNYRQSGDSRLENALNSLCVGNYTDEDYLALVKERTVSVIPDDVPVLAPLRSKVDNINSYKLKMLNTEIHVNECEVTMTSVDDPLKLIDKTRFAARLEYAENARVIMLTNTEDWVNGSLGTIVKVEPSHVLVKLDNSDPNEKSDVVIVCTTQHHILDRDDKPIVTFKQYPFQLAWAITIHKSQGMTLDKVGIHMDRHFAPGMTYVAMTRCKRTEGLYLLGAATVKPPAEIVLKVFGDIRNMKEEQDEISDNN